MDSSQKEFGWVFTNVHRCGGEDIRRGNGSRCEVRARDVEMNFISDDVGKYVVLLRKVRP